MNSISIEDVARESGRQQGLAPAYARTSILDVATASVGIHAARSISAVPIVSARISDGVPLQALRDEPAVSGLIRIRCMRKTLHILPLDLARVAHFATIRYRYRDCMTQIRRVMSDAELKRARELLLDKLRTGWCSVADLDRWFTGTSDLSKPEWRLVLKLLWENAEVICHNAAAAWNREERYYRETQSHLGDLFVDKLDEVEAERKLVHAYLHAFAPSSARDIAWWAGLSRGRVMRAIESLSDVESISVDWCPSPLFVLREQLERLSSSVECEESWVRLVGHEDVSLKAYHETRNRYVEDEYYGSLFNSIGEALPAVVVDGRVAGVWKWNSASIETILFPCPENRSVDALLATEIARLAGTLSAWESSTLNPIQP